jgi:hypothetical protein
MAYLDALLVVWLWLGGLGLKRLGLRRLGLKRWGRRWGFTSETRREYVRVGLEPASMRATVSAANPQLRLAGLEACLLGSVIALVLGRRNFFVKVLEIRDDSKVRLRF